MAADVPSPTSEVRSQSDRQRSKRSDFWALIGCNLVVFCSSICIMVVELCASRLIAPYLGSSLYTWTSVIGIVLAGISIGNYLGGWISEKFTPQKALGWLFLVAGLSTASVLILNRIGAANASQKPEEVPWQFWVMAHVALAFLAPAVALGTISPVTASIALKRSQRTGVTVGNIYAWGAMGSIVGTFLAGFWLIDKLGTHNIIWITACVLLGLGAIVAGGQRALRMFLLFGAMQFVLLVGVLASVTASQSEATARFLAEAAAGFHTAPAKFEADDAEVLESRKSEDAGRLELAEKKQASRHRQRKYEDSWADWASGLGGKLHDVGLQLGLRKDQLNEYNDESDYYAINIYPAHEDGEPVKVLRLDYLIHSYYNPAAPNRLHYDYEEVYAAITERAAETWNRTRSSPVEPLPELSDPANSLPARVKFDAESKRLSALGALSVEQAIQMLSILPDAPLTRAITKTWRTTSDNWKAATRFTRGTLTVPVDLKPETLLVVDQMEGAVSYDRALRALVFVAPFSLEDAFRALAIGESKGYVEAVRDLYLRSRQASTLFIGGGGFIFPRWVEAEFPYFPRIDVAEIDPAVLTAVQREMGLSSKYGSPAEGGTWVRTHIGDARKYVDDRLRDNRSLSANNQSPVTYDFVYGDAFNDLSVPWHLTTREFSENVRGLLTPDEGVYLVNIIDVYPRAKFPGTKARLAGTAGIGLLDPLPEGIFPEILDPELWYSSSLNPQLQIRRRDDHEYTLGYRGVMDDATRDKLIQSVPGNNPFAHAVRSLHTLTNNEPLGRFLGRYVRTARSVFPYVYVFTSNDNENEPGELRDTFVVACSLKRLSFDGLFESGSYWHNKPFASTEKSADGETLVDSGEMPALLQLSRGIELTDDFAPVDNLLAPVFASRNAEDD